MDAYCYALSTIKKLGYICDTLLYLTDFQPQLFSRRSNKKLNHHREEMQAHVCISFFLSQPITFQRQMIIKLGIPFVLSGFYTIFAAINY